MREIFIIKVPKKNRNVFFFHENKHEGFEDKPGINRRFSRKPSRYFPKFLVTCVLPFP